MIRLPLNRLFVPALLALLPSVAHSDKLDYAKEIKFGGERILRNEFLSSEEGFQGNCDTRHSQVAFCSHAIGWRAYGYVGNSTNHAVSILETDDAEAAVVAILTEDLSTVLFPPKKIPSRSLIAKDLLHSFSLVNWEEPIFPDEPIYLFGEKGRTFFFEADDETTEFVQVSIWNMEGNRVTPKGEVRIVFLTFGGLGRTAKQAREIHLEAASTIIRYVK